jgi:hypothetical protein
MNKQTHSQQIVADIAHQAQHEKPPGLLAQFVGVVLTALAVYALIVLTFSL